MLALVALLLVASGGQVGLSQQDNVSGGSGSSGPAPVFSLALGSFPTRVPTLTPIPTAAPSPTPTLPAWVQVHRATTLWAGPELSASAVAELPQWRHLRPLGPVSGERLLAEEPGDGIARLPSRGWVNAAAIGPSNPPEIEWHLALQPDLPNAPRWEGESWPQYISAEFAAIVDGDSGQVLYGKNAHQRVAPASLTKIATAVVTLERGQLNDQVTVSVDSRVMPESTVMGITPGERLSLEVLLYGLMLPSGNDAALAIAQHIGGSEAGFVQMMNDLVTQLELKDTHFANPHGLDAQNHYSSPYDMATLARYGMRYPAFQALSAAKTYQGEGYTLYNLNRLLWSYEGADGVKPGYTDLAGRAVVGSATRDGHRVYVALMRSPDLWGDTIALLDYAFKNFRWR